MESDLLPSSHLQALPWPFHSHSHTLNPRVFNSSRAACCIGLMWLQLTPGTFVLEVRGLFTSNLCIKLY